MPRSRRLLLTAIAAAPLAAAAQEGYPSRPARVLVGASPGGATDITARILFEAMAAALPRGYAIENRAGANGNIAAEAAAHAAPDGTTLLMVDAGITAINPVVYRSVGFDPERDFAPIALIAEFPFVTVVHPSVPVRSFPEFVAWAKAEPSPVLYASPGAGSQHHLGMEIIAARLGLRVTHVPYRGGAPATTDLLAGQIKVGSIGLPPLVPHLREGRLRALTVSTAQRSPLAPDVPSLAEAGLPGLSLAVWYGLVAPRGTPADILRILDAAVGAALARSETVAKLAAQGLTARFMDSAAFAAFMAAERTSWGAAARAANLSIE